MCTLQKVNIFAKIGVKRLMDMIKNMLANYFIRVIFLARNRDEKNDLAEKSKQLH